MTRPRRCAQFAFQMRREERERAPPGVMLYIWTCMLMCVCRSTALFSQCSDVCGQSKCSLSQPMCYTAACVTASN